MATIDGIMSSMEIFGYCLALAMGVVLGVFGGGGSILSVPIFLYCFHMNAFEATTFSLLVVSLACSFASLRAMKSGLVDFKSALYFSIPSFLSVTLMRSYLLKMIPAYFEVFSFSMSKDTLIISSFSIVMFVSGMQMILKSNEKETSGQDFKPVSLIVVGFLIGLLTGFIGAGGGFLIVPALSLLIGLPIKRAIGTSFFIISMKTLIGFLSSLSSIEEIRYEMLTLFVFLALIGVFFGQKLSKRLDVIKLKKMFGAFVLIMSLFTFLMQI